MVYSTHADYSLTTAPGLAFLVSPCCGRRSDVVDSVPSLLRNTRVASNLFPIKDSNHDSRQQDANEVSMYKCGARFDVPSPSLRPASGCIAWLGYPAVVHANWCMTTRVTSHGSDDLPVMLDLDATREQCPNTY